MSDESFFRASTPDGRLSIDVVVGDRDDGLVEFWGRVAVDKDWAHPIEELKTEDQQKLIRWVGNQMIQMMRRSTP